MLPALFLILLLSQLQAPTTIMLYSDGYAFISQVVEVSEMAVVNTTLLATPLAETLLVTDVNGTPLLYELNGSNLTVYALGSPLINVTYFSASLASYANGTWRVHYSSPVETLVKLPENSILVDFSPQPISLKADKKLTLLMPSGEVHLAYTIALPAPASQEAQQSPPTEAEETEEEAEVAALGFEGSMVYAAMAVAAAAAGTGAVYYARRSRSVKLSELAVVEYLKKRGGSAYQYEIMHDLNIPRATLSRIVKNLEQKGVVTVTKVARFNLVKLKEHRESS